jgi:sodium-dependent dicarboxylate transporter 2/3/5
MTDPHRKGQRFRWIALAAGLVIFAGLLALSPPQGLSDRGWAVICVGVLMTIFWFTEAIPVTLTGLVPFMALPLLGVLPANDVAASYFSPVLFLILGGFFLALAMEKWGLHKRTALFALSHAGGSARGILFAVMMTTALISMFVTNSAATLAMLPVALAIVAACAKQGHEAGEQERFGRAMVLGIAYGSTMGGFGLPVVLIGTPLAWLLLSRAVFPFKLAGLDGKAVGAAIGDPGRWSATDIRLLLVLGGALALWTGMPLVKTVLPNMSDPHVSLFAALALFIIPAGGTGPQRSLPLLNWDDTKAAPWHLLVLLGGGLALAEAINRTDLSPWLQAHFAGTNHFSPVVQLLVLCAATLFVTEFVTNTATVSAFLPATLALAGSGEINPVTLGMITAFAANWGFMMPAGTTSLALAYGTGRLTVAQMAYAGLWMDLGGVFFILAVVLGIGALVL